MRVVFVGIILLVGSLAGCGGDGDADAGAPTQESDVLHLRGFDITAAHFRSMIRGVLIAPDSTVCDQIGGFSPSEAVDAFDTELRIGLPTNIPIPNATPISDQARRNRQDEERAAQIAIEECAALNSIAPSGT